MFAHSPRRGPHRQITRSAAARLGRLATIMTALAVAALVSAAIIPSASAGIIIPDPGGQYGPAGLTPVPGTRVRVITAGMAGWQVVLIAAGVAVTAGAAVRLERALAADRAGLAIAAWRSLTGVAHRPAACPAQRPDADLACPAVSTQDTSLLSAGPAPSTPDVVEFG